MTILMFSVLNLNRSSTCSMNVWWPRELGSTFMSLYIGFQIGVDYESVAKLWLCNKKFGIINMITLYLGVSRN
jgi:hypothetical protein